MQPPPQAAPSGLVGPPPVGNPRGMFWSNSPYRRRVSSSVPAAPVTCPLQPVTDPFAFSRQVAQDTSLDTLSRSSLPVVPGPAPPAFSQHPALPTPHTGTGDPSQGPREPVPGPFLQPGVDASLFSSASTPSAQPGPEANRSTERGPSSAPNVPTPPNPPQCIPGVGPDSPYGAAPGPARPLSRQNPRDSAGPPAVSSFFPQPPVQMLDSWVPVQGGPRPSGQHCSPCPEGPGHSVVPRASGLPHFPPQSRAHQSPAHEQQHSPLAPGPGPLAGDERNETAYLQSGNHSTRHFDPENTFRQSPRVGPAWASQEFRQNPGGSKELRPDPALANPLAQGNGPDHHLHYPPGAGAGSAALSMFFQGGEMENEENLSAEKAGSGGPSAFDGFCPNPGLSHRPPAAHMGTGSPSQAFLQGPSSETTQPGGDSQPYFSQSAGSQRDQPTAGSAAAGTWGDPAGPGTCGAFGPQCENVENLEFIQNQEVLPSEPLGLSSSSQSDPFWCGALPGPPTPKSGVTSHVGGGGPHLEAPSAPVLPDSVSSSYSSKDHRAPLSSARPQELVGTFIQQEVVKLDEEASGSFFKQIDSSPVGGEMDETPMSQNYRHSLSQPSTPSPPKPTGVFQTSANSSFEPVKSHFVGVKPVEADRANVVGEVRGSHVRQKKRRPTAALPDASPGNLEQPPDNMETLFTAPTCLLPLSTSVEAGHVLPHTGGPPSETGFPTPEKRSSARAQGAVKCESPATTLWAQNELPDFGGNVLLAPAAPALCVPTKPQASEVIQPPDEGVGGQQPTKLCSLSPLQNRDGIGASENLENPPKMSEEEAFQPQAGSGYASLLPSPPPDSLHSQPVLIAQPDQSYNLAQPVHFSVSLSNHNEKNPPQRDPLVGDRPALGSWGLPGESGESASLLGLPLSAPVSPPLLSSLAQGGFPQASGPETVVKQPASLLAQPSPQPPPVSLASESLKNCATESVPPAFTHSPAGSAGVLLLPPGSGSLPPNRSSSGEETSGALDFTLNRTLGNPVRMCSPSHSDGPAAAQQSLAGHPRQPGPGAHDPDCFYQQVTQVALGPSGLERAQLESGPPQQPTLAPQMPKAALPEPSSTGSPPAPGQAHSSAQPPASPAPADTGQQVLPGPPRSSSMSVTSASSSQAAGRSEPQWPPPPPPPDLSSYYYYRSFYDLYPPQYPLPYLPEPGTAPVYYKDTYGLYRPYDSAASAYAENYRFPEPERPSSRASHCSDRPAPRQGYPDGYYHSQGGWSSQSDYYASYCSSQYDYGDPGHWDRYHYGSRFRDTRSYDRRHWYDAEYNPYRKETYAYGDRPERYDDPWRYDPRFTSSFEEDPELHRDPYGDEGDRRSVHSEHSAQSLHSAPSLHSRRSSVSAHSQQSQIYRNHNVTAGSYDATALPGSFHGDYGYGTYGSDFSGVQAFPEYGYPAGTSWPTAGSAPSRPSSPEKFSVPHVCARFGPGGQLIKVIPNLPSEGQPALVELHSMETLLQHSLEQEEMRSFPGPLGKDDTHKVDVINFAQNKATKCLQNENIIDKESASLLWNFIILLCRQNGTVVGTDIAELLLRDHKTVWLPGKSPSEANLIDFTNEAVEQVEEEASGEAQLSFLNDSQAATTSGLEKDTERFRELLLYGRKKDALESAMKSGLWGHALLLASKMDSRTHARVMTRFANSLPINDPLQTVYQLMSGRMPAASTCCGDEKWGDWRPHLAMVLSNLNNSMEVESRTMTTMGDTLASKGLLDAAHFCYLMAQAGFGVYTKRTTKLVLIGSNHSLPFLKFATNEAIQRTEAYEYAQSLGAHTCSLPHFQVFKFIYACRLADMGLATQAFHYCEVIAKSILAQPHAHSAVLISQLVQVASRLRLFDPQLKEKPEEESSAEPPWLVRLQRVEKQMQEGAGTWQQDGAFPPQCPSTPSSEVEQYNGPGPRQPAALGPENPLLLPLPNTELSSPSVQLLPSATQQPGPAMVPLFPVLPPAEPGPVCAPPGSALGFPEPARPDLTAPYPAPYPGPGVPAGVPAVQQDEPGHQDSGVLPQESPVRSSLSEPREDDFGGNMAHLEYTGQSQDSEPPLGWEHTDSGGLPPPELKKPVKATQDEVKEPKKTVESWFSRWLPGKRKTEAYLPDDKNKSIVWDEKKNQWVNLNEPEEEKKAPPPPPTAFPRAAQNAPPGPGGTPRAAVNVFSRKAARTRARYVDVLNPSGTTRGEPVLAPAEFFAPLAPLPIPAHLFVPNPAPEEPPPAGVGDPGGQVPAGGQAQPEPASETKIVSSAARPPGSEFPPCGADTSRGGELSRCSSVSSLSREVSQHFDQAPSDQTPAGGPPGGAVPFYNPAQFAQVSAASGGSRMGRMGQRQQPALN